MLDDVTLALLGDHDAAERLTERGELLPCPWCKGKPSTRIRNAGNEIFLSVACFKCGVKRTIQIEMLDAEFNKLERGIEKVVKAWNTRAPILSPTQLAALGLLREPRRVTVDAETLEVKNDE